MKIFGSLGKARKKKNGHERANSITHEDILGLITEYDETYRFVEAVLNAELSREEELKRNERFHMAPLSNLDEEYLNLFSNPPMDKPARRGKSAYLRDAYHNRIRQIVNALNIEGVTISSYVDMVLTDHLMRYEDQIDQLLQNCNRNSPKQKRKWEAS